MNTERSVYLSCFLRSYLVGSAFNMRSLQSVGFINAIDPGLRLLYPDPKDLGQARARYMDSFNCHPYFTPLLLGAYLNAEKRIASGTLAAEKFLEVKDTAANTLSGLGDSLFGGSLLVSWALMASTLLVADHLAAALALTLGYFGLVQAIRFSGFLAGLREGLYVLGRLRRMNLINWSFRLKILNAVLLFLFLATVFPPGLHPWQWMLLVASLLATASLALRQPRIRVPAAMGMFVMMMLIWGIYYGT